MDLLHQFDVKTLIPFSLFGIDVSFTNASLYMLIAVSVVCLGLDLVLKQSSSVPSRMQSVVEMLFSFVSKTIETFCGSEGKGYFVYIFILFSFIFMCNLIGLIPGSFTVTSQLIVTFSLALTVFISVTIIGIMKHGLGFIRLFVPHGIPWYVLPLLVPAEIISYFSRPLSLSIRLFANMVAGHILLKVFASFAVLAASSSLMPLAILPLVVNFGLIFFELVVAFLQAYVFTILTCIYLKDALHLH